MTLLTGDKAPDFSLPSEEGKTLSLSELKGKRVILYFYPKDDTPGCTKQACGFRDNFSAITSKDVILLGISPDSVASHHKFKDKYDLPFILLADENHQVCEAYGIWKERSLYGRKFMGVERTTFLIDAHGKIEKIWPRVKVEGHVEQIIQALTD